MRGLEELSLLNIEMENCIKYWKQQESILRLASNSHQGGIKVLLNKNLEFLTKYQEQLEIIFYQEECNNDSEEIIEEFTDSSSEEEDFDGES